MWTSTKAFVCHAWLPVLCWSLFSQSSWTGMLAAVVGSFMIQQKAAQHIKWLSLWRHIGTERRTFHSCCCRKTGGYLHDKNILKHKCSSVQTRLTGQGRQNKCSLCLAAPALPQLPLFPFVSIPSQYWHPLTLLHKLDSRSFHALQHDEWDYM